MLQTRRRFIKETVSASIGASILADISALKIFNRKKNPLKISLAEWSLNNALYDNEITNLDFPLYAKKEFDINAVEYVSRFFKGTSNEYLAELLKRTNDNEVTNVLIMVDDEGDLAFLYDPARIQAVERHYRWVEAAKILGCHSIRVNAKGEEGTPEEAAKAAVDGLGRLVEYGEKLEVGVIVENHGGYSSDGKWLANVISQVNSKFCGSLPDFGNFCIKKVEEKGQEKCLEEYDRYLGMKELMPFARGVSAKSNDFDEDGNETSTDYRKMMQIILDSGYNGYIGIEYEKARLSEKEGIIATRKLLEKAYNELAL